MPTESELFDQALQAEGIGRRLPDDSIFRTTPLFSENKALVDRLIQGFRNTGNPSHTLLPILVDYVDSDFAGACAVRHHDVYVLAINFGLMFLPYVMFNILLCDRDFLPELGNVQNESENAPRVRMTASYREVAATIHSLGLPFSALKPQDPIRRDAAHFLGSICTNFFMGHEFRHIQAGHADYYNNNFRLTNITETISHDLDPVIAMKMQAMEWDADRFSIRALLAVIFRTRDRARMRPNDYYAIYQNDKLLALLSIIACAGFFTLLDRDKPLPAKFQSLSHPPSRNRRVMLASSAIIWLELTRPDIFDTSIGDELARLSGVYLDASFANVFNTAFDRDYSILALTEGQSHQARIMDTWRAIMDDLAKYSYVKLEPF